jgi:hypothetical protein
MLMAALMKSMINNTTGLRERAGALVRVLAFAAFTVLVLLPATAAAQPCGGSDGYHWGMMGGGAGAGMWISLLISWMVGISAIVALVSVAVFLLRRSKL